MIRYCTRINTRLTKLILSSSLHYFSFSKDMDNQGNQGKNNEIKESGVANKSNEGEDNKRKKSEATRPRKKRSFRRRLRKFKDTEDLDILMPSNSGSNNERHQEMSLSDFIVDDDQEDLGGRIGYSSGSCYWASSRYPGVSQGQLDEAFAIFGHDYFLLEF